MTPSGRTNVSFVVNNNSNDIFAVKTELICISKYTIPKHNSTISKKKVIHSSTIEASNIPDNSVSNMSSIISVAPDIYTVRHSNLINREYKVRVTLKLPLPHVNSSVEIPVFVGESLTVNDGEADELSESLTTYWNKGKRSINCAVYILILWTFLDTISIGLFSVQCLPMIVRKED